MKPFTSKHCTPINYGSPLKHERKEQHTHVGEDTDKIKRDEKSEYVVNMFTQDTLRPTGRRFNPNKVRDGYLMGGDYPVTKTSDKNFKLKK